MFILKDSCKGEAICLGPLVSQHILAGCTNPGCRPWLLLIRQHLSLCLRKATLRDEVIFLPEQGRLASTYYQGSASPQVSCSFPVSATHLFSSIHREPLGITPMKSRKHRCGWHSSWSHLFSLSQSLVPCPYPWNLNILPLFFGSAFFWTLWSHPEWPWSIFFALPDGPQVHINSTWHCIFDGSF